MSVKPIADIASIPTDISIEPYGQSPQGGNREVIHALPQITTNDGWGSI